MKSRKLYLVLGLTLVMALLAGVFGCQAAPAPAPTTSPAPATKPAASPTPTAAPAAIKLTGQTGFAPTHPLSMAPTWWMNELKKRTNGKVEVQLFYGTPLGETKDQLDMVLSGSLDFGFFSWNYKTGVYPLNEVFYMPVPASSAEATARAYLDLYKKGYFDKENAKFKVLWLVGGTPAQILSKSPIRKLEDFKGRKVRGAGLQAEIVTKLGGSPVNIASAEAYQAMEKGVIDASLLNIISLYAAKLHEVAKYLTIGDLGPWNGVHIMNPNVYKSLPKDVQQVIDGLFEEASIQQAREYDKLSTDAIDGFKKAGVETITLSSDEYARWQKAISPIIDKWIADNTAKGFPAKQLFDDMLQSLAKYK